MKTLNIKAMLLIAITLASSYSMADSGASQYSGQASKHAVLASGNVVVGTAQAAAHVAAVPLIAIGAVGEVSGQAGKALLDASDDYAPLEISEAIITKDPSPEDMMQGQEQYRKQ